MCRFYVNSDKSLLSSTYAAAFQANRVPTITHF